MELEKFSKEVNELETTTEKWACFFKHAPETTPDELKRIEAEYPTIGHAYNVLAHHAFTQEQLDEYYGYEMKADEINTRMFDAVKQGKAVGLAEGELKKAKETADKMLQRGMSVADISEITGLSVEEIDGTGITKAISF